MKKIWDGIEKKFGFRGVKSTPIPHFTWHVAFEYEIKPVEEVLVVIKEKTKPIEISTSGLDFFKNEMFVAYNGLNKSRQLANLHKSLCKQIMQYSKDPMSYYLPDAWKPHVTILFEPKAFIIEDEKLTKYLKALDLKWHFAINNLTVIHQSESQSPEILFQINLA